ncbi:hypothetical protein BpHYR1_045893 [Brachionus plicatilis]|uniref:Uncharacterized protein n=1 Tax=Brachionus plicatilis TaxID=10195 RepID=A0A3M7S7H0_BRAPC|nr:hypothetical protein BpHYR1_045893 [Brachionus plicatilis]
MTNNKLKIPIIRTAIYSLYLNKNIYRLGLSKNDPSILAGFNLFEKNINIFCYENNRIVLHLVSFLELNNNFAHFLVDKIRKCFE